MIPNNDINKENYLLEIINSDILDEQTKQQLIEYSNDQTIHSLLNLTFKEILFACWRIIKDHIDKNEILKILLEKDITMISHTKKGLINPK